MANERAATPQLGSEWVSTRYLRDFGASKGINGHEETSKLFGVAADRIDWLERKVLEVQGQLITRNSELASAMAYGHKHRLEAALAKIPAPRSETAQPVAWMRNMGGGPSFSSAQPHSEGWTPLYAAPEGGNPGEQTVTVRGPSGAVPSSAPQEMQGLPKGGSNAPAVAGVMLNAAPQANGDLTAIKATNPAEQPAVAAPLSATAPKGETPRTDDVDRDHLQQMDKSQQFPLVTWFDCWGDMARHARQLERELAEVRADLFEQIEARNRLSVPSSSAAMRDACHDAAEQEQGCFRAVRAERLLREALAAGSAIAEPVDRNAVIDECIAACQEEVDSLGAHSALSSERGAVLCAADRIKRLKSGALDSKGAGT